MTGTVTAFDERRGLGEITADDGTTYPFHCTAIADGTRTIAVGTAVEFEVVPGQLGRWEAAAITSPSASEMRSAPRARRGSSRCSAGRRRPRRTASAPGRARRGARLVLAEAGAEPVDERGQRVDREAGRREVGRGRRPCSSGGVTTPRWTSASCQIPSAWLTITSATGVATSRACSSRSAAISSLGLGSGAAARGPGGASPAAAWARPGSARPTVSRGRSRWYPARHITCGLTTEGSGMPRSSARERPHPAGIPDVGSVRPAGRPSWSGPVFDGGASLTGPPSFRVGGPDHDRPPGSSNRYRRRPHQRPHPRSLKSASSVPTARSSG